MKDKHAEIDKVSSSFCLAKWLQVTVDLVHGTTHSCHHPKRHFVPLDELKGSPSALHNTQFKKEQRKLMLEGIRPPECEYCWKIEDALGPYQSDRMIKSSDPWSFPHLEKVKSLKWHQDIAPTYLEVMLDNTCNLSCSYCLADISTLIAKEMKNFGPYPVSEHHHRMPEKRMKQRDPQIFLKAFWQWLPEILPSLEVFRITGGEPFLSKNLSKIMNYLFENPNPHLNFAINTNLSVPDPLIEKYFYSIKKLLEKKAIHSFELYTSIDSLGAQAEYIRHGLDSKKYWENIEKAAKLFPKQQIVIMVTFNILSITGFKALLEKCIELKKLYPKLILDLSYLKDPKYLRANLADTILKRKFHETIEWFNQNSDSLFNSHEREKIMRVYQWVQRPENEDELTLYRSDFFKFIHEYDRRYQISFLENFPEMKDFLILSKQEHFKTMT